MNTVVVGLQYGDEGKGKVIYYLCDSYDWVVRYQGGANAGHTVHINGAKYVLHQVPTGILRGKKCYIGNGCVVDVGALKQEIQDLQDQGVTVNPDLLSISPKAHVLFDTHIVTDIKNNGHIGTTNRGIGPAYSDKINRKGIRFDEYTKDLPAQHMWVGDYVKGRLDDLIESGNVLFEGAQGTMLDVDHGTYPYVTSSNTTSAAACTGTGFPITKIDQVIGVAKAYVTRVGEGPFNTRMSEKSENILREIGNEYGATTGRPRNCGWINLDDLEYASKINGVSKVYLTRLDTYFDFLNKADRPHMYLVDGRRVSLQHYNNFDEFVKECCGLVAARLNVKVSASIGPEEKDIVEL